MRYTKSGQPRGAIYTIRVKPYGDKWEFPRRKNSNTISDLKKRPFAFEVQCMGCKEKLITGQIGRAKCPKCGQRFTSRNGFYRVGT